MIIYLPPIDFRLFIEVYTIGKLLRGMMAFLAER